MIRKTIQLTSEVVFACALVAFSIMFGSGCSGEYPLETDDAGVIGFEESDIGSLEQTLTASCLTPKFGANIGASDWSVSRCNKDTAGNLCVFSPSPQGFRVALATAGNWLGGSGPLASGNNVLSAGNFARSQMNSQFGNWATNLGAPTPFAMNATENALGGDRVLMYNGAIAGGSNVATLAYKDVVHMACLEAQTVSENYSASFGYCKKWAATLDYNKVHNWALFKGVGDTGRQRILKGLMLKVYAQAMGYGQRSSGAATSDVNNSNISATVDQNTFSSEEYTWGNNYVGYQLNPTVMATHEVHPSVAGKSFVMKDAAGVSYVVAFNSTVDTFSEARARINAVMLTSGLPPTIIAGQATSISGPRPDTLSLKSSGTQLELLPGGTALAALGFSAGVYNTASSGILNTEDLWVHCVN